MLDDLFDSEEIPKEDIYRAAQKVVKNYMDKTNKKIEFVAGELGTTKGYLYSSLDPKQTNKPLSIDRIIDITKLTEDYRIIESITHEVGMLAVLSKGSKYTSEDIHHLVDMANIEGSDVFKAAKDYLSDGKISPTENEDLLKEIEEAETAFARLKNSLKNLKLEKDK